MLKQQSVGQISKQAVILGAEMLKNGATYFEVSSALIQYFTNQGIRLVRFRDGIDLLQYCMDLSYEVHLGKRDYQLKRVKAVA